MPPFILVRFLLPLGWLHLPLFALLTPSGGVVVLSSPFPGSVFHPGLGRGDLPLTLLRGRSGSCPFLGSRLAGSINPTLSKGGGYRPVPHPPRLNASELLDKSGGWLFASGTLCELSLFLYRSLQGGGGGRHTPLGPWVPFGPGFASCALCFLLTWGGFGSLGYSPLGTGKRRDGEKALQPNSRTASKSVLPVH